MDRPRVTVLIPAAGSGRRVGHADNKILLGLGNEPMIRHTVRVFQRHPRIERIGLIVRPGDQPAMERCFADSADWNKLQPWIPGGPERQDSVFNGLQAFAADPPDWVLVHDGARPLCSPALIDRILEALLDAPGVVPLLPLTDTVRRIAGGRSEIVDRTTLFRMQTPQGFHWSALWRAHLWARERSVYGTDDAQLLEQTSDSGKTPLAFVQGEAHNLKITTAEDLRTAEWLLAARAEAGC